MASIFNAGRMPVCEPAHTQDLSGRERQRRSREAQKDAHAYLRAQLTWGQQGSAEEQAHTESNGGNESNDYQFSRAEPVRQVKTGSNSDACADKHT